MVIANRLKAYLDQSHIRYETISHATAYTAQEVAAAIHTPGRELAKTVILAAEDDLLMVVLPAPAKLDLAAFKREAHKPDAHLADEAQFRDRFPDCEVGAMPPFGNLYDVPVYVAEVLREDEKIAFNAGSHNEAIRMNYEDFERTVHPTVLKTCVH